jgi:hypothetical protein
MIHARPGASFTAILEAGATGLAGTLTAQIENADGTSHTAASSAGIVEIESTIYAATRTAPDEAGTYVVIWVNGSDRAAEELVISYTPPAAISGPTFATAAEVAAQLGRELDDAEETLVDSVLVQVTALIADFAGEDADWPESLDPVPAYFRTLSIQKAITALSNPSNLASYSETLGAHQYSETYPRGEASLSISLTRDEERRIRRALGRSWRSLTLESPYSGTAADEQPELEL